MNGSLPTRTASSDDAETLPRSTERRSEYADYMRTDELLRLQRPGESMLHRDERLFQCVHQSTELWLKQAVFEIDYAIDIIASGELIKATQLLGRVSKCMDYVLQQLDVLSKISSRDFAQFRPALGNGSGLESPGWTAVRAAAPKLWEAFSERCRIKRLSLSQIFSGADSAAYALAEALLDVDTKTAHWRLQHLVITVRTIGHGGVGTKGMPVDSLARMLNHRLFPDLWEARSASSVQGSP